MANRQEKIADSLRNQYAQQGQQLTDQSQARLNTDTNVANDYRGKADAAYDPLLQGKGGYTPDQADSITREGEMQALRPNQDQLKSNFLTPDEYNAIGGNPSDRMKAYNPAQMEAIQNEGAQYSRQAVGGMKQGLSDAIDPSQLSLSNQYQQGQAKTLAENNSAVLDPLDPSKLTASDATLNQVRMSDADRDRMVEGAGITVGNKSRAAIDDMEQKSRAAGMSPLGAAAMSSQMRREGEAEAGDSMTQARIAASAAQAARAAQAEGIREQGNTTYAGMKSGAERGLGDRQLQEGNTEENLRLGAAQDLSGRKMSAATTGGQADVANEQNITNSKQGAANTEQQLGSQLLTGVNEDTSNRAALLAENRQQTGRENQQQNFQQGDTLSQQLSGANKSVADVNQATRQEGRQYLTGEQGLQNQNVQNEANRQVGIFGTQAGAENQAAGLGQVASNKPGLLSKVVGGVTGAASAAAPFLEDGGIVTEPTQAILGEKGPEMVVPLSGQGAGTVGGGGMGPGAQGASAPQFDPLGPPSPGFSTGPRPQMQAQPQGQSLSQQMPMRSPAPQPQPPGNGVANPGRGTTPPLPPNTAIRAQHGSPSYGGIEQQPARPFMPTPAPAPVPPSPQAQNNGTFVSSTADRQAASPYAKLAQTQAPSRFSQAIRQAGGAAIGALGGMTGNPNAGAAGARFSRQFGQARGFDTRMAPQNTAQRPLPALSTMRPRPQGPRFTQQYSQVQ